MTTWYEYLVAQYTGLSFSEIARLGYIEYLTYRRDAYIHMLEQTEAGQEYLENAWRLTQEEPDRPALRKHFKKGDDADGE